MIYYYDLHIHTVLSPCADVLMTPHNIFNMANLKGLNLIAITDHNSTKQLPICNEIAQSYDLLFIPGIEISVKEGFHVLCYFKRIEDAMKFGDDIENYLDQTSYDTSFYGEQHLTDINDEIVSSYPYLLSRTTKLSMKELQLKLKSYEHILMYAHLDRPLFSGIDFINEYTLHAIELTRQADESYIKNHQLQNAKIFRNSDAHQLTDLLEKTSFNQIELNELNIESFFAYFNHG